MRLPSVFMTFPERNKKIFAKKRSVIFPTSIHSHFSPLVKIIYLFFAFFYLRSVCRRRSRAVRFFFENCQMRLSFSSGSSFFSVPERRDVKSQHFLNKELTIKFFWDEVCSRIGVRVWVFVCVREDVGVRVSVWERAFQRYNSVCVTLLKTVRVSKCECECESECEHSRV